VLELMDNGWSTNLVDLGGLTFMDSSGLRMAFELDTEAGRRGIALQLTRRDGERPPASSR
jgi:anti-anti-sigma regulatory factor